MTPSIPAERRNRILEILRENRSIRVRELTQRLGVSEMTVRRDLDVLDGQGLLRRTHGGALVGRFPQPGLYDFAINAAKFIAEKKRIAQAAARLIEPDDVVFLTSGSTTAELLNHLDPELPCRLVSNNVALLNHVGHLRADIVILGGVFHPKTLSLVGPQTLEAIGRINAAKCFIGVDGVSLDQGLTDMPPNCAQLGRAMAEHTRGMVICVADHSKFEMVATYQVVGLERVDVIITDQEPPAEFGRELDRREVRLVVA